MAWTNVFALGDCTVEVWDWTDPEQPPVLIPPADYAGLGLSVDVSEAGVVTLTSPEVVGSAKYYFLVVRPSFSIVGLQKRLTGMQFPDQLPVYAAALSGTGADLATFTITQQTLDPGTGQVEVDPYVFPMADASAAGFAAGVELF
jgi:hypothetical protein